MEERIRVAVTVDELVLWDGSPIPPGDSAPGIVSRLCRALDEHGIEGVYGFPHTYPLTLDPGLVDVLSIWTEAGHHIGSHTHFHAPLPWISGAAYVDDIRRGEDILGEHLARAPRSYFRYAMDMSGDSEEQRGVVEDYLRANSITNAPITSWFGDFAWIAPYFRALHNNDRESVTMLRESYVSAAVFNLQSHARVARRLFGRDVPLIWLVHGSPIAGDMLGDVLSAFEQNGVEFVSLDEAMNDQSNRAMPPAAAGFHNHLDRYLIANGIEPERIPAEAVQAVMDASPLEGYASIPDVYEDAILKPIAERARGNFVWSWT
ncbi:polysaccharide deacetylase family protein [Microbacterium sp. RD1]|uniref:polysaccharide deacetylase family protein n=1 Tax=Microbacterium sp. RD1 TaxID=3457313 RepID=UPI003FA53ECA